MCNGTMLYSSGTRMSQESCWRWTTPGKKPILHFLYKTTLYTCSLFPVNKRVPPSTPLHGSRMLVQWTALIQSIREHGCDPLRDRLVMPPCFCRGKASDPDSVLGLFSLRRHLPPDKLLFAAVQQLELSARH